VRGTATGLIGRGLGLLVAVVSVPLTVRYLGAERYGVWVTISSFLAFLSFTDFGLANSLTNALGKAYGEDRRELARSYVSSAFWILCLIALGLIVAGSIVAPHLTALVFPRAQSALVEKEITPALIIAFVIFALNFPLLITSRVLAAHQENALANLWSMAGGLANLTAILLVIEFQGGLLWLVLGCSGFGLVTNIVCAIWLFGFRKPWLRPHFAALDPAVMKDLFSTGWKFLVIGAGWMINSQTDNFIIAHYLGACQVTPYNVTFQLFANATLLQTLLMPSLWPAYTEAYARKDFVWIRRSFRLNFITTLVSAGFIVLILIACGLPVIRIWAGPAAVPPFALLIWMGLWNIMLSNLYAFGCLLNAIGRLRTMMVCSTVTAVMNIFLSILLVRRFGICGVIAGTVVAFLIADYLPIGARIFFLFREFRTQRPQADDNRVLSIT
jgi:O-antigen/teichoic acid export membrane protein